MTKYRRLSIITLAVLCTASLATWPALGQEGDEVSGGGSSALPPTPALGSPSWSALGIPDRDLSALDRRVLTTLSEEALRALLAGVDPAQIPTMSGQSVAQELAPLVFGSIDEELVFTPVTPCRVIDTRAAVGAFGAGETRNYDLIGPASYAGIGGSAAGCSIPADFVGAGFLLRGNKVRALVLNIVAVGPAGPGDFRAYPSDEAVPNASVINYAQVSGLNIANGILLKTCASACNFFFNPGCDPCASGDLSFLADVAGSDLVVDVVGFFVPASVGDVRGASAEGTAASTVITDGLCHSLASASVFNGAATSRGVVCTGSLNLENTHTFGTTTQTSITLATDATTCNTSSNPPEGVATWEIPSAWPSDSAIDLTLTTVKRFTLASSTSDTFFVNAERFFGAGFSRVDGGNIVCILDQ